ncbi:hypothetical protein BGZ51_006021 [Haplosporangium sp. Z 767]|nr:hypothetical protein BGZ50_002558 [Haplosporangium sp. Z 11]KAF9192238.1 hypothetical protein BGZ51_006021 [Haplosporangium sp. Z 767]
MTLLGNLDCAICLDNIRPKQHAKAILACRHEFHLSCISMAFSLGKEMICPLCRFLHKNQPFMGTEDEDIKPVSALPSTTTAVSQATRSLLPSTATVSSGRNRNRNNSIHLQHNLSNLVQHQQRRRSTYDLRRPSVSMLSSIPTSPTAAISQQSNDRGDSVLSMMPFFGTSYSSSHNNNSRLSYRRSSLSSSSFATSHHNYSHHYSHHQPAAYLSTSVWFMLYGMPFSVAILFLAFILGQVETLWSKISCLFGSVICYMVCWAVVVAFLLPTYQYHLPYPDDLGSNVSNYAAASSSYPSAATGAAAMEYEFDVVDSYSTNMSSNLHMRNANPSSTAALSVFETESRADEVRQRQQAQHHEPQQQQQQQDRNQENEDVLVSSAPVFSWLSPGLCSFSRWMVSSSYAQDLQSRMTDFVEVLDEYCESFCGW